LPRIDGTEILWDELRLSFYGVGRRRLCHEQNVADAHGNNRQLYLVLHHRGIMLCVGAVLAMTLQPKTAKVAEGIIFQPQLGFTMADGGEKIKRRRIRISKAFATGRMTMHGACR